MFCIDFFDDKNMAFLTVVPCHYDSLESHRWYGQTEPENDETKTRK